MGVCSVYVLRTMGNKTFRMLDDYARHETNIRVVCRCHHVGICDARTVSSWFMIHRWPRAIEIAHLHFRCSACGQRGRCQLSPTPLSLPITFPRWGPHTDADWKKKIASLRG